MLSFVVLADGIAVPLLKVGLAIAAVICRFFRNCPLLFIISDNILPFLDLWWEENALYGMLHLLVNDPNGGVVAFLED